MKIANSIYDVVFKYLMEDYDIAKDILSAILNEEIISIEFMPQEAAKFTEEGLKSTRFDFKCVIRNRKGELRTVIIEIQKAKTEKQIFRFRGYLGSTYLKKVRVLSEAGKEEDVIMPITSIYFLGENLQQAAIPILKIDRVYTDLLTGEILNVKEFFVEHLSHDLYVIQIKRLNKMVKTDLEKILDVFNQDKYQTDDNHILEYTGDTSDPRVERIVKRLNTATMDYDLLDQMIMEDAYEADLRAANNVAREADERAREAESRTREAESKTREAELRANEMEKDLSIERKAKKEAVKRAENERIAKEEAVIAMEATLKEIEKLKAELNKRK
jgi:hypothetical protein